MKFDALTIALLLARALRDPLDELARRDRDLADQARRATSSLALNLSEGRLRVGKDRAHAFRIAAGSAGELHTALRLAVAWGYLDENRLEEAYALLDREHAMLWNLTH